MNIFILDYDTNKCVKYYTNKHIVKMPLETAQLLCNSHYLNNSNLKIPYKLTHSKHPCSLWTSKSLSNYLYLCKLGLAICKEYTYRYNKVHKSQKVIEFCTFNLPKILNSGLTKFVQAMPNQYKNKDVVIAYRKYYNSEKQHLFQWKNRETPHWIKEVII